MHSGVYWAKGGGCGLQCTPGSSLWGSQKLTFGHPRTVESVDVETTNKDGPVFLFRLKSVVFKQCWGEPLKIPPNSSAILNDKMTDKPLQRQLDNTTPQNGAARKSSVLL